MGFWSDISKKVMTVCLKYGEEYEEICNMIIEDINQYHELWNSMRSKFGRRGGKQ